MTTTPPAVVPAERPPFCLFSLSAGSSTLGRHSLIHKLQLMARRGFNSVELFQDDLTAFAESDDFSRIYHAALCRSPPLSPELSRDGTAPEPTTIFNAFGPCTPAALHREVAAAAYIGNLSHSLGIQVASLQPLRDFEGWAQPAARTEAFQRAASRFEIMHALGTHMLFICSNCQPVASLVSADEYAVRAGADLAELAERAQSWNPVQAAQAWRKLGWADPVDMMRAAFPPSLDGVGAAFPDSRLALPLSPPASRLPSFSEGKPVQGPGFTTASAHTPPSVNAELPRLGFLNLPPRQPIPGFPNAAPTPPPTTTTSLEQSPRTAIRIGYEALSWGTHVDVWRTAWAAVSAADSPHVGIVLDSFNTVAREWADPCSPSGIAQPEHEADARLRDSVRALERTLARRPEKIFFLQIADARRVPTGALPPSPNEHEPRPARMIWSRSNRLFPLETERGAFLPILDFVRAVARIGYRGPWSVEVFSDSIHEQDAGVPVEHVDRGYRSLERLVAAVLSP